MLGENCGADTSVVPEAQYASLQCHVEVKMCRQAACDAPRPCQMIEGDWEKWSVQPAQMCDTVSRSYLTQFASSGAQTWSNNLFLDIEISKFLLAGLSEGRAAYWS